MPQAGEKIPSREKIKKILLTEVPALLKRDPEIRGIILDLAGQKFMEKAEAEGRFHELLAEIKAMRLESERKWEEDKLRWQEDQSRWEQYEARWQENQKRWEEYEHRWQENQKRWEQNELRWQENQKRWEQSELRWQENQKRWEQNELRWQENQKRWEQSELRWQENQNIIRSLFEEIKLLHRKHDTSIGALGARWGLRAESAFRNAIKGILEESFPVKVERYMVFDDEGIVFGKPEQVEVDVLVKDGDCIGIEIKSSMSKADVYSFLKKIEVAEAKTGKPIGRKIIISPMVDKKAMDFAKRSNIQVYGYPEEVELNELFDQ